MKQWATASDKWPGSASNSSSRTAQRIIVRDHRQRIENSRRTCRGATTGWEAAVVGMCTHAAPGLAGARLGPGIATGERRTWSRPPYLPRGIHCRPKAFHRRAGMHTEFPQT
jgi:hypothetical protein